MTIRPLWRVVFASLMCLLLIQPAFSEEKEKKEGEHDWLIKHPTIQRLLELHNQERARNGMPALTLNTKMCLQAQEHATWMADTGYYQHSNLPWPEIIFQGPTSAAAAVNGWIASPAHHSIMLTGSQVGFGYMIRNGQHYWVGVFK
ncbi:MAG: hypothetical protein CME32_22010 [Gimesia sp.]|uniref:Cysteine-rich secretory protein family protein n=1 Tax=Gimesia chilikensis TaxID=2605989 RepID=A0A517PPG6_9PLAN|nr:hypothetical protein [Gimesia sp.]QDT21248.1 Cysteine-rich secretory protein family protein [Gimesia chilikensis]